MLKDTSKSACFATLFGRCLTYCGKDSASFPKKIIRVSCSRRQLRMQTITHNVVLLTTLNLESRLVQVDCSEREVKLAARNTVSVGQKVNIDCGTLEFRGENSAG